MDTSLLSGPKKPSLSQLPLPLDPQLCTAYEDLQEAQSGISGTFTDTCGTWELDVIHDGFPRARLGKLVLRGSITGELTASPV